jgi:hypothetical protein
MTEPRETGPSDAPLGQLERSLIDEFVRSRGHSHESLGQLPEAERERLLREASLYASVRMAEVESRSHYVHEIHHASGVAKTGLE